MKAPTITRATTTFSALMLFVAQAVAQQPPAADTLALGTCFVDTDEQTWKAMGLDNDQLEKVKAMQTACKTDCAVEPETKGTDANISGAVLKRYEEELRTVLAADQYAKWTAWCGERPMKM